MPEQIELALALLLAALSFGCAHRPVKGFTYQVPSACLTRPVDLVGCDQNSPPNCQKVAVHYKPGCEIVNLKPSEEK